MQKREGPHAQPARWAEPDAGRAVHHRTARAGRPCAAGAWRSPAAPTAPGMVARRLWRRPAGGRVGADAGGQPPAAKEKATTTSGPPLGGAVPTSKEAIMRGRIVLFVVLAVVLALGGVYIGWSTNTPKAVGEPQRRPQQSLGRTHPAPGPAPAGALARGRQGRRRAGSPSKDPTSNSSHPPSRAPTNPEPTPVGRHARPATRLEASAPDRPGALRPGGDHAFGQHRRDRRLR